MEVRKGKAMIEEIDWNELWKKASLNASWRRQQKNPIEYFDRKAKWYNKVVMKRPDHIQPALSKIAVDRECTVLDIGSGPGALSIPLAKAAANITAVEPSEGMLHYLKENAQKEGIENITYINKKWEDVELGKDIGMHDFVIASHSLAVLDIQAALSKMDRAAVRGVYILASAGKQAPDNKGLWSKLYGKKQMPGPNYMFMLNVLYQMGIFASVEVEEKESRQSISSLDEAVKERMEYFEVSTPQAEEIIREHLSRTLHKDNEGALWSIKNTKSVIIWWEKKRASQRNIEKNK